MLEIVPMTLREANAFVEQNHRHHGATVGHKFSIGLSHGGVKLTAKTARTLAMQEFGTARGLTKSTSFVGAYFMEFGNLRIEICADAACIAVRVVLAHGTGSSVKYFDPDTLQENFKAIDKHREDEDRAIISDWVNLNGPEYCRKQVEAIWKQGG